MQKIVSRSPRLSKFSTAAPLSTRSLILLRLHHALALALASRKEENYFKDWITFRGSLPRFFNTLSTQMDHFSLIIWITFHLTNTGIYINGVFKGSFGNIGNVIVAENIENETAQPGKAVGIGTNP